MKVVVCHNQIEASRRWIILLCLLLFLLNPPGISNHKTSVAAIEQGAAVEAGTCLRIAVGVQQGTMLIRDGQASGNKYKTKTMSWDEP